MCSRLKLGVSGVLIDYKHIQFGGLSLWQHLLQVYQAFFLNYSVSADLKTGIILPLFKGKGKGAKANNKDNASVNSKHQHPARADSQEFFYGSQIPCPQAEHFAKLRPWGKKVDNNPTPGNNFVDLQDNFAMIVKPFAFFWYSSLAWLSSSFFKDYKACKYKISQ